MSEETDPEQEFREKINKIIVNGDVITENGRRDIGSKLNVLLSGINRINIGRDLVADIDMVDSNVKVDIFCRNERLDQLKLKMSEFLKDPVKNSNEISELNKYVNRIQAIGTTQV